MGKKKRKKAKARSGRSPDAAAAPPPAPPEPEVPAPDRRITALIWLFVFPWILSFTPHPIVWGTFPGLIAAMFIIERGRSLKEVILWLVVFGTVATGIGYRWLAATVQLFGDVPPVVSWVLLVLFGAWNVVHGFLFAWIYRGFLKTGTRPHPFLVVVAFVACETLPIRMFGWMAGHGAIDFPPLAQAAEWGGVAGVSLALLCLVLPLFEWIRMLVTRDGPRGRPRAALATFLVGLALVGVGAVRVGQVREREAKAKRKLRIAIVQGNVGSVGKRMAAAQVAAWRRRNIEAYTRETRAAMAAKPDLIVWPETAITDVVPIDDGPEAKRTLSTLGFGVLNRAAKDSALLVGFYERERSPGPDRRYNVAALRSAGADGTWSSYRKVYLIPFGETMPFGILEDQLPQPFRMLPGPSEPDLLRLGDVRIAAFICYEAIIPGHVRAIGGGERPDLLVNLTNDSWFGDTWEPHQHLNFARFRAIEHRAPLVRATNTGISAFVSPTGEVASSLGVGKEGVLTREVPIVRRGRTLYETVGHHLPLLLWVVTILAMIRARRLRSGAGKAPGSDAA